MLLVSNMIGFEVFGKSSLSLSHLRLCLLLDCSTNLESEQNLDQIENDGQSSWSFTMTIKGISNGLMHITVNKLHMIILTYS